MPDKIKIIIITDGDQIACRAIEEAGKRLNLRTISASRGNPTRLSGAEFVHLLKQVKKDPALVMVDDCGNPNEGNGEKIIRYLSDHPDIEVLGVLAVASNQQSVQGVEIDFSIDRFGEIIRSPVDKEGNSESSGHKFVEGDTVGVLRSLNFPLVVGIGDIGKMDGADGIRKGAKITTKAIQEILNRSGIYAETAHK